MYTIVYVANREKHTLNHKGFFKAWNAYAEIVASADTFAAKIYKENLLIDEYSDWMSYPENLGPDPIEA